MIFVSVPPSLVRRQTKASVVPIPFVGWFTYFTDPDNNIHGVYENVPNAG